MRIQKIKTGIYEYMKRSAYTKTIWHENTENDNTNIWIQEKVSTYKKIWYENTENDTVNIWTQKKLNTYKLSTTLWTQWDNNSKYCCQCISLFQKKRGGVDKTIKSSPLKKVSNPRNGSFQSSSCRLHGGYRWKIHCNKCKDSVVNIDEQCNRYKVARWI